MNRYRWLLEIIESKRNDPVSIAVRLLLFVLSIVYRWVVQVRNWAYDRQILKSCSLVGPVVSVGNLTVGGTGKTPMVIWLAETLVTSHQVTVISRGYGAQAGQLNDEGLEISQRLPEIELVQNQDRVAAAQEILSRPSQSTSKPVAIILDDGFQHRRLSRDLDIVLIDATQPFGFDFLLPRGYLREPVRSVRRADVAVLSRSNLVDSKIRSEIQRTIRRSNPKILWAETKLVASYWQTTDRQTYPLDDLRNKRIFAFCGIGNPVGFLKTLTNEQLHVVDSMIFPDHYSFAQPDLERIFAAAKENDCQYVVCTQKDMVKVDPQCSMPISLCSLVTRVEFTKGEQAFFELVRNRLTKLKDIG